MFKKISTILLASAMLCTSMTCGAFAVSNETTIESNFARPLNTDVSFKDSGGAEIACGELVPDPDSGNIIRVKYENLSPLNALVVLSELDSSSVSGKKELMRFDVPANGENQQEYTAEDIASKIYYINIYLPNGGVPIEGNLSVRQIDSSGEETQPEPEIFPFTDVPENAWYRDTVEYVYENGLFSGTSATAFSPERNMTRAEIITVLGNMYQKLTGQTIEGETPAFSDVQNGAYYAKYIDWAQKNGIVAGFTDGKFHPDDVITREQLAVIVNKYIQISGKTFTDSRTYTPFADEDQISRWAKDAVVNMAEYGIMSGKQNNQFAPKNGVIRAEAATVIMNLHQNLTK